MKLSYRGINYEKTPSSLEIREGEIAGKYRGQPWSHTYPRHIPHLKHKIYLQYRGVAYSTCPLPKTTQEINNLEEKGLPYCSVPVNNSVKFVKDEIAIRHSENIRVNLERRLEIAKAKNDSKLIRLLEKEFQQLVLTKQK